VGANHDEVGLFRGRRSKDAVSRVTVPDKERCASAGVAGAINDVLRCSRTILPFLHRSYEVQRTQQAAAARVDDVDDKQPRAQLGGEFDCPIRCRCGRACQVGRQQHRRERRRHG